MQEQAPQTDQPPMKAIALVLGGVFVLIVVVVLVVLSSSRPAQPSAQTDTGAPAIVQDGAYSTGVNPVEPKAIRDVALLGMDGQAASLSDLNGNYTVLYFGYTFCPDFCPATLTDYRLIARELGEAAARVNFVLVSVDPARDTPEILSRYVTRFNPDFLAYTGDLAALDSLMADFNAFYDVMNEDTDSPYYMVSHTASSFVLDPEGRLVTVYTFGTEVDVIVQDLQTKLAAQ
jgi:protein SCO1